MEPFATIDDYEARFGDVPAQEQATVEQRLSDASVMMAAAMQAAGIDYEGALPPLSDALVVVCCNVAHRTLQASADAYGVTQYSQGAGGYSESFTYANPSGDMYMTKAEKRMLGIGGARIGCTYPYSVKCGGVGD